MRRSCSIVLGLCCWGLLPLDTAAAQAAGKDALGDPLPPHALARMGTTRWQLPKGAWFAAKLPDGKTLVTLNHWAQAIWWEASGKKLRQRDLLPYVQARAAKLNAPSALDNAPIMSADGKMLAALDMLGDLHVWDSASGNRIRKFATDLAVAGVAFTADGKQVVAYGISVPDRSMAIVQTSLADGDVQVRLLEKVDLRPKEPYPVAGAVGLRGDGQLVFVRRDPIPGAPSRDYKSTLFRIDLNAGNEPSALIEAPREVRRIVLSPDGRWALLEGKPALELLDVSTGKKVHTLPVAQIPLCVFSADSKQIIGIVGDNQSLAVWDTATGKKLREFGEPVQDEPVESLFPSVVTQDNKTLICFGARSLHLIDLATGKELYERMGHNSRITDLSFSADGKYLLSQAQDMTARVWDVGTGREVGPPVTPPRPKECFFLVAPDLKTLVTAEPDGTLNFMDPKTRKIRNSLEDQPKNAGLRFLAISADSRLLGVLSPTGDMLRLYDLATAKLAQRIDIPLPKEDAKKPVAPSQAIVFSSKSELVALVLTGQQVVVWDTHTAKERNRFPIGEDTDVRQASFSPDGKVLAVDHFEGRVVLWELKTGKRQVLTEEAEQPALIPGKARSRRAAEYFLTLAFSPDGRYLARAGEDGKLHLWNVLDRKHVATFGGQGDAVVSLAFSPDGARLASSYLDNTVIIWKLPPSDKQPR